MAISKIILNGVTQMDLTADTVAASNLIAPNTAHGADGQPVTGTKTEKVLTTKSVTANGTYDAEDDNADGYSEVTVNVPSSGSSSWTKVAEASYQVSTTSTSATTVDTLATGHNELWTSDKWVYVRIRDTAGKRAGYFYGSDQFFYNVVPINGATDTSISTLLRIYTRYSGTTYTSSAVTGNGYGVYIDKVYSDGRVRVCSRYNSTGSLTINGTYKVEVYLLDTPDGVPIFN